MTPVHERRETIEVFVKAFKNLKMAKCCRTCSHFRKNEKREKYCIKFYTREELTSGVSKAANYLRVHRWQSCDGWERDAKLQEDRKRAQGKTAQLRQAEVRAKEVKHALPGTGLVTLNGETAAEDQLKKEGKIS